MKQTENYGLNQWELTDRIQMEDFNSDNQKIDSQLHAAMQQLAQAASQEGLAAEQAAREAADAAQAETLRNEITAAQKWVKLGDATLRTASNIISITIPNAEKYAFYFLFFDVSGGNNVELSWTGMSSNYPMGGAGWDALVRDFGCCFVVPFSTSGALMWYQYVASSAESGSHTCSYGQLLGATTKGTITLSLKAISPRSGATPVMNSGSCFRIYGLKK